MTAAPRRRWFRFSLRTLLVMVTVFGAWFGVQVKWIRDRHEWLKNHPQVIIWADNRGGPNELVPAPWSLRILGEPGIRKLYPGYRASRADFEQAKALFPEAQLEAGGVI